jgi:epoxyqueuosine reductase
MWLQSGFAGQMDYMHRNLQKRINPAKLMEAARSVIVVGLNYTPPGLPAEPSGDSATGRVANYALYEDYHPFVRKRLRDLTAFISSLVGTRFDFKICVDSAPLAERALAVRAGLGFIGHNHMLINPELGCQIFLGEIVTSLELPTEEPIAADCLDCDKCIRACPTGVLRSDGQFDAGRCINYLTIEHKGSIPSELAERIGDRLFGCDECVLACPYQKSSPPCGNRQFKFYGDRTRLDLNEILEMDVESFDARFDDSPIKRPGLESQKRNARICLANEASK